MTKANRTRAKLLLTLICLTWMAGSSWVLFRDIPEDEIQTHKSEAVKEKMKECEGTFKQRYDCKEAIVIESGRDTFWNLTTRLLVVTIPAMLLGMAGSMVIHRIPIDKPPPPPRDLDWKSRAQAHIQHPGPADHQGS